MSILSEFFLQLSCKNATDKDDQMKRITTKEAAQMLEISEQGARMMIQLGKIPGATCWGPKHRKTYYITDEMVKKFKKGE